jgi:hypothetical protein
MYGITMYFVLRASHACARIRVVALVEWVNPRSWRATPP